MSKHNLTAQQVADLFDFHEVTVRKWRSVGNIPLPKLEWLEGVYQTAPDVADAPQ